MRHVDASDPDIQQAGDEGAIQARRTHHRHQARAVRGDDHRGDVVDCMGGVLEVDKDRVEAACPGHLDHGRRPHGTERQRQGQTATMDQIVNAAHNI